MKNELTRVFSDSHFGDVRVVLIGKEDQTEDPWFIGKDVAEALGYANTRDALSKLDEEDRKDGVSICDSLGREQKVVCINESGLYSLIFSSQLETAKQFKRWVTSEVLPTLRKQGYYSRVDFAEAYQEIEELKYLANIIGLSENKRLICSLEVLRRSNHPLMYALEKLVTVKNNLDLGTETAIDYSQKFSPIGTSVSEYYGMYLDHCLDIGKKPLPKHSLGRVLNQIGYMNSCERQGKEVLRTWRERE